MSSVTANVGNLADILRLQPQEDEGVLNLGSPNAVYVAKNALDQSGSDFAAIDQSPSNNSQEANYVFTKRLENATEIKKIAKPKMKKVELKSSLVQFSSQFDSLTEELKKIKLALANLQYEEIPQMKSDLKDFQARVIEASDLLSKIEPAVIEVLNRLGPTRCNSVRKGPQRSQLRTEIIQLWGKLGLASYQLDLEAKGAQSRIAHLPQLIELQSKIEREWTLIREFKGSDDNVTRERRWSSWIAGNWEYIRADKKEEFLALTKQARHNFINLYNEALACKKNLQKQISEMGKIPEKDEYAFELAFGNYDQEAQNINLFGEARNQAVRAEDALAKKIKSAWEKTCVKLDGLQAKVLQVEIAAEHEEMLLPYETTAKNFMDPKYILCRQIEVDEEPKVEANVNLSESQ